MVATLFYVDALPDKGELAVVDGDEGFHAATVRRIRPGEGVLVYGHLPPARIRLRPWWKT